MRHRLPLNCSSLIAQPRRILMACRYLASLGSGWKVGPMRMSRPLRSRSFLLIDRRPRSPHPGCPNCEAYLYSPIISSKTILKLMLYQVGFLNQVLAHSLMLTELHLKGVPLTARSHHIPCSATTHPLLLWFVAFDFPLRLHYPPRLDQFDSHVALSYVRTSVGLRPGFILRIYPAFS